MYVILVVRRLRRKGYKLSFASNHGNHIQTLHPKCYGPVVPKNSFRKAEMSDFQEENSNPRRLSLRRSILHHRFPLVGHYLLAGGALLGGKVMMRTVFSPFLSPQSIQSLSEGKSGFCLVTIDAD
ncbi:hypothetical protein AVEN_119202-1 [Araneus ventricosus]|uniref:Uncharacterized protein n=1 Tax=Araneus ventricosus TaxID=182803 RepID=A0A4Y2K4Q6_ARAVE|nr:hypothetical protein AVEN_119202-1 [Araneus ventricosus]